MKLQSLQVAERGEVTLWLTVSAGPSVMAVLGSWAVGKQNAQLEPQGGGWQSIWYMGSDTRWVWIWVPTLLLINIGTLQKVFNLSDHQLWTELGGLFHFPQALRVSQIPPVYSLNVTQWYSRGQNRLILFLICPVLPEIKFICRGFIWRWGK